MARNNVILKLHKALVIKGESCIINSRSFSDIFWFKHNSLIFYSLKAVLEPVRKFYQEKSLTLSQKYRHQTL